MYGGVFRHRPPARLYRRRRVAFTNPKPLVRTLQDNFNDNSRDVTKWSTTGGAVVFPVEQNGRLEIPTSTTATGYGGFDSINLYSLYNSQARVRVVQPTAAGVASAENYLGLIDPNTSTNAILMNKSGDSLYFNVRTNNVNSQTSVTWSSPSMDYWSVEESNGNILFKTSPDGLTWTTRRTVANPTWSLASVRVSLTAGTYAITALGGTVIYDDFNFFTGVKTHTTDAATLLARRRNLVTNPNFESDTLGAAPANWTTYGSGTKTVVNDFASGGTKSYKVTSGSLMDGGIWIRVDGLPLGGTVNLSAWVKTDASVTNASMVLDTGQWGLSGSMNQTLNLGASVNARQTVTLTGLDQTGVIIFLGQGSFGTTSLGTVWYDDVQLEIVSEPVPNNNVDKYPTAQVATTTSNRFPDGTAGGSVTDPGYGGFIFGMGGTGTSALIDSSQYHNNPASYKISTTATGSYIEARLGGVNSYWGAFGIPIRPGYNYSYSFWMKTNYVSGDSASGAYIDWIVSDTAGAGVGQETSSTNIKTTTGWTLYTGSFTAHKNAAWVHPELRIYGHNGTGTLIMDAWFDEINLVQTSPIPMNYFDGNSTGAGWRGTTNLSESYTNIFQIWKIHTTDGYKRVNVSFTKTHTTDANKRKAGLLKTHTTDANKRVTAIIRTHTTDGNKRKLTTKTHTTDANKRKLITQIHTTDGNKRKTGLVRTHTTDALKRIQFTKTHTTDALLRRKFVVGGYHLDFDGVNDDATWTNVTPALPSNQQSVTLAGKFRLGADGINSADSNTALSYRYWYIHFRDTANTPNFRYDNTAARVVTGAALGNGNRTWHTFVAVYEWITDTNMNMTLYIDGVKTTANHATLPTTNIGNGRIGRRGTNANYFTGDIKDIRVFHAAANDTDAANIAAGINVFTPVADFRFYEGTGTTLYDMSGNGNDATISGAAWMSETHTTSANKRRVTTQTHTTDTNKRKATTKTHTTDANKRAVLTRAHTTSANKRLAGILRTHTTDSNKRKLTTKTHTTDAFRRRALIETVQDDFDFGGVDIGKWSTWGSLSIVATTNLRLEITSQTSPQYGGLLSLSTYDLTGSSVISQLTDAGNQSITSLEVYPMELVTGSDAISVMVNGGIVYARKKIAGVYTTVGSTVSYNSSAMQWFRIREASGTTYWEYASNPTGSWTTIASAANPITVTNLTAGISVGTWQAEGITSVVKVDNYNVLPGSLQFTWKGLTWNKRVHQGDPGNNQWWSKDGVSGPDGSDYLTLSLTNPSGDRPYGSEFFSEQRGFGYGTYTAVIGTRLDTLDHRVAFGNLFLFDFTDPPAYREIDVGEARDFNSNTNIRTLQSHTYNSGGTRVFITDDMDAPSNAVVTYRLIWTASSLTYDVFLGTGTGGTNYFHTVQTTNLPTPGLERVHFNIWNNTGVSNYLQAPPTDVVIRDFTFSATASATRTHTTDANKRKLTTKTHSADANKRKLTTKTHTTDANKRVANITRVHTTDGNKRKVTTRTHTTDAFLRKIFTKVHTTDANKRKAGVLRTHTTDANKRKVTLVTHTTDANKRKAGVLRTHTTDALIRKVNTRTHTTDAAILKARRLNLVPNPSFEVNLTGWTPYGGTSPTLTRDTTEFYTGVASMKIVTDGTGTGGFGYMQGGNFTTTGMTPGKTYTCSVYIKGPVGKRVNVYLGGKQGGGDHRTEYTIGSTGWVRYSDTFIAGNSSSGSIIGVEDVSGIPQTYYVDSVLFEPTPSDSLAFTASTGGYVAAPYTFPTDAYTVLFWYKATAIFGNAQGWFAQAGSLSIGRQGLNNVEVYAYLDASADFAGPRRLRIHQSSEQPATDGLWHSRAYVIYVNSSNHGAVDSYQDGSFVSTSTTNYTGDTTSPSGNLGIGSLSLSGGTTFNGSMDRAVIVNRKVTPTEITAFHNGAIPVNPGAIWSMDEGTGTVVSDSSPYNNDGAFAGGGTAPAWQGSGVIELPSSYFDGDQTGAGWRGTANNSVSYTDVYQSTRFHTTDTLKRKLNTLSHSTDGLKRKLFTKTHTTDALKRLQSTKTHTTDANKRRVTTRTHTADANKRRVTTKTHTTSANKRLVLTRSHTTDAAVLFARRLNFITNPQFDNSIQDWSTGGGVIDNTYGTVINPNSFKFTSTGGFDQFHLNTVIPVKAGDVLTASVYVTTLAAHTPNGGGSNQTNAIIYCFWQGSGVSPSEQVWTGSTVNLATIRTGYRMVGTLTAPANATAATFYIYQYGVGVGYYNAPMVERNATVTPYFDGDSINAGWRGTPDYSTSYSLSNVYTGTHTTDAYKRTGNQVLHSTDANKRKIFSVTHTTSTNKRTTGVLRTHTTDANKRKLTTRTHTTDTLLRKQVVRTHTTDANKRKLTVVTHTTDANKKRGYLVSHTADGNKRRVTTRTHTTDANKRKLFTLTHTTDTLKRRQLTLAHTTDSFLRRQIALVHTTSANKRKATVVSHTTDTYRRTGTQRLHSTDANKRKLTTRTHSTDANKRVANLTRVHSTDGFKRKTNTRTHTTDANKRRVTTIIHTTDALKRRQNTGTHTTDASVLFARRRNIITNPSLEIDMTGMTKVGTFTLTLDSTRAFDGTNSLKLVQPLANQDHYVDITAKGALKPLTTYTFSASVYIESFTGVAFNSRGLLTTNAGLNPVPISVIDASTPTGQWVRQSVTITTTSTPTIQLRLYAPQGTVYWDALQLEEGSTATPYFDGDYINAGWRGTPDASQSYSTSLVYFPVHTTNALLRKQLLKTHTTDANKRKATVVSHSTDALKRKVNSRTHSTDANKRRAGVVSHTTNANKRRLSLLTHTTDTLKRTLTVVSHSTDTVLSRLAGVQHTTDANKRKLTAVYHTTDVSVSPSRGVTHSTDASLYTREGTKKVLVDGVWHYGVVRILIDGGWYPATLRYYDGTAWQLSEV